VFQINAPLTEREVGVRAAREQFPELLTLAETGDHVIHLTRRGERVGALVSANVAESLLAIRGVAGPVIPGDVAGVITVVENLMIPDGAPGPDMAMVTSGRRGIVGGCISLIDAMFVGPVLQFGKLNVIDADGSSEVRLIAELLVTKLYNRPDINAVALSSLPLVAGSLWSAQTGGTAVDYRLGIPIEVSDTESYTWLIAVWELCQLINAIHGDGSAEDFMYDIEETLRSALQDGKFDLKQV
jgi:hypothetical protein